MHSFFCVASRKPIRSEDGKELPMRSVMDRGTVITSPKKSFKTLKKRRSITTSSFRAEVFEVWLPYSPCSSGVERQTDV